MKSWKKLLLCIAISVLITTFIGMSIGIVRNNILIYRLTQSAYKDDFEKQILENARYEEFNKQYNVIDMVNGFISATYSTFAAELVGIYILSIGIGIALGLIIYLIFVEKKRGLEAIIAFFVCSIISLILVKLADSISYTTGGSGTSYEWYQVLVVYAITFIILYIVNLMHQKHISKKLNQELKQSKNI